MRASEHPRRGFLTPALWIPAGLALGLLGLPLVALVVRAPWASLPALIAQPAVSSALVLSLVTAVLSTGVSLVLGIPLALVLARSAQWPAVPRRLLRALVTVPLVLPPVVGGVALLLLLGRRGLIGQFLPFQIPFSTTRPTPPISLIIYTVSPNVFYTTSPIYYTSKYTFCYRPYTV